MTEDAVTTHLRTGLPAVDGVIDQVAGLAQRPIEEHVAVYESAHEVLRGALDGAPDER